MTGVDFIVAIRTDEEQAPNILAGEQWLEQT